MHIPQQYTQACEKYLSFLIRKTQKTKEEEQQQIKKSIVKG